jgi:hypothetical protein
MPPIGNWLSRTNYAYSYLARSVHGFSPEKEFLREIADAGLVPLGVQRLSLGIAKIFSGIKKDELVKSLPGRHSREGGSPEALVKTGFPPPRE